MKQLLACLAFTCLTLGVMAKTPNESQFQASLNPEIAIHPTTEVINGLTLSIWGENPQHALSIGFVNGSSGTSGGFCLGLVNYGNNYTGVQWGIANVERGTFLGWQAGAVNVTGGHFTGLQFGWINYAATLSGLQLGLLNIAEKTDTGVQIGIVNVILQNTIWFEDCPKSIAPAMVLVNWRL